MNAALLVLGMHRSGTSALTRVLSLLGAELPRNLMPGVEGHNDLGHWESLDLMAIHDEMLASAGSCWHDVTAFPADWHRSPPADRFRERILEVLDRDYRNAPLFVVKDPRVCRFVPIWLDLLDQFGAVPHVILPIRNPLEVASSLKRRDSFPIAKGALLWLRHILDAEQDSRDCPRSLVTYDSLLDDWGATTGKISRDLGLTWPRGPHRAAAEIEEFLSTSYRHHRSSRETLRTHSQIVRWVEAAYDALLDLASADVQAPRDRLDTIRAELLEAERAFGPLLAEAQLALERSDSRHQTAEARTADLQNALKAERDQVAEAHRRAADLQGTLQQRDSRIADLESALKAERDQVAEAHRRAADLQGTLQQRDSRITDLESALENQTTALADRDARIAGLETTIRELNAALANRDDRVARLEADRTLEETQSSMLRRLIYETQQVISRDLAILDRVESVERRGLLIEAKSDRLLSLLQPSEPEALPIPHRPGRRWWSHLSGPSSLKQHLKPTARRVLTRVGMLPPGDQSS